MVNLGGLDEEVNQEIRDEEQEGKITALVEKKPKRRPFHYWKVGNREYKLKLITGMIEKLENKYRQNILNLVAVDGIPPLSTMPVSYTHLDVYKRQDLDRYSHSLM